MHDLIYVIIKGELVAGESVEYPLIYTHSKQEATDYIRSKQPFPEGEWYDVDEVPHLATILKES